MFGTGGGNSSGKDADYGGPGEGASHFGGSGLGSSSGGKTSGSGNTNRNTSSDRNTSSGGGQTNRSGGSPGNSVGDRDRQGPGNVGGGIGGGMSNRSTADRNGGGTNSSVGDTGGMSRDIRSGGMVGRAPGDVGGMARTSPSYDSSRAVAETGAAARDAQIGNIAAAASRVGSTVSGLGRGMAPSVGDTTAGVRGAASAIRGATAASAAAVVGASIGEAARKSYRDAIASIESAGSGDYGAVGPTTKKGDNAYGRYQVMGENVPSWTKAALGKEMTPQEFLNDPVAQDKTFDHIFGGYVDKYGLEGAAQAWFGGTGSVGKTSRTDQLGTSVGSYGKQFTAALGRAKRGETQVAGAQPTDFASRYLGAKSIHPEISDEDAYLGPRVARDRDRDFARLQAAGYTNPTNGTVPAVTATANAGVAGNQPEGPQPGTEYPDRPRSLGEKVAAAGIDLGLGMIPGIGQGVSLVNGGLALTNNRTLGERFVDAMATGEGGTFTPSSTDPNRPTVVANVDDKKEESTVPPKTESFEDRYLAFVDNTKRPTPGEKWGNGSTYAQSEYA